MVDPRVRAIAITGMGGLGKTALVGHWLSNTVVLASGPPRGCLGGASTPTAKLTTSSKRWSEFATKDLGLAPGPGQGIRLGGRCSRGTADSTAGRGAGWDGGPAGAARGAGSGGPGQLGYGEFLDDDLRTFLDAACRLPPPGAGHT